MPHGFLFVWPRFGNAAIRHGPRLGIGAGWTWEPDNPGGTVIVGDLGYYVCFGAGSGAYFTGASLFLADEPDHRAVYGSRLASISLTMGASFR